MSRRIALFAPLAVFAAFLVLVLYGLEREPDTAIRSALIGKPAPAFDLPGYDATHPGLATSDLAQGSPTLVNVFASWCLPCRVEAPQLQALANRGIVVHGIAVRDSPDALARFFKTYGNPFRRIAMDPGGRVQIALGSAGVPETFVIDGAGIIRHQHIGDIRAEHIPGLIAELERAR